MVMIGIDMYGIIGCSSSCRTDTDSRLGYKWIEYKPGNKPQPTKLRWCKLSKLSEEKSDVPMPEVRPAVEPQRPGSEGCSGNTKKAIS